MSENHREYDCLFDDRETRRMGEALTIACDVAKARYGSRGGALRRDLAAAMLEVGAYEPMDKVRMAHAAIDLVFIDEQEVSFA
jgi:hypothetical protein